MQSGLATKSTSSAQESGMLLVGSQRFVYIQVPQVVMNLTFTLNGRDFVLSIHLSDVGRVVAIEDWGKKSPSSVVEYCSLLLISFFQLSRIFYGQEELYLLWLSFSGLCWYLLELANWETIISLKVWLGMTHLTQSIKSISCYFSGICFMDFDLNCKRWTVVYCLYVVLMLNGQALQPVSANILGSEEQSTSVVQVQVYILIIFFFLLLAFLFRKNHKHRPVKQRIFLH